MTYFTARLSESLQQHGSLSGTPRKQVAEIIARYKKKDIDEKDASDLLLAYATEQKDSVVGHALDFIDILNRGTKQGQMINTATLRKMARKLNVKEGVLDLLDDTDKAIALRLIATAEKRASGRPFSLDNA